MRDLSEANRRLRELDRFRADFVANVSHELRTPLTSIQTAAGILAEYPDEEPVARVRFAKVIQRESVRLLRLVNDLLDVAKIEAGRIAWNLGVCLLGDILDRSIEAVAPAAAIRSIRIEIERERSTPALFGDRDRLQQALVNILGNAVKFSPDGAIVRVRAGLAPSSVPHLFVSVKDQGPGIPESRRAFLFRKFEQAVDAEHGKPCGTGLGLVIVKEIVEAHGGRIEIESAEGQGAEFRILLPAWNRVSEFHAHLSWRIRHAAAWHQPLGILVLGSDGAPDADLLAKRLRVRLLEVVRSSMDAVVLHERKGFAAVLAESKAAGMESIRARVLERIARAGLGKGAAVPGSFRSAVAEHPRDGADADSIAANLATTLQSPGT